ncbi:MAG: ACT domain-containing protein [Desulfovibrio sp.]|jgi:hypothetical protein|nr:ACT domain-containing protein [Desulfovibrio sp.]
MSMDQISVFVENSPGRLADITEILGTAGIDLRAVSIADTADFGVLRLISSEPQKAMELLRSKGCVVSVTPVLAVELADTPGSLAGVLRILADAGVSIEYLYAFITRKKGNAYVILRVEDNARAEKILADRGVKIADADEIYAI